MTNTEPIYIEVLTSPNCPHSPRALKVAKTVVSKKFKAPVILREVSVETEEGAARAQEFEVNATPTIAINGRVAFVGVPEAGELEAFIHDVEKRQGYRNSYFF